MVQGQDAASLLSRLQDYGFQNVRIDQYATNAWRVDLENGRYRFTPFGFRRFMEDFDSGRDTFHFVFRERDIATAHMTFHENSIQSTDWDDGWLQAPRDKAIKGTSNFWQVNIPIGLGIRYTIGIPNNHEAIALDILPGIDITFSRGLSLQGSVAIPVVNDFDPKDRFRLNHLALVQDIRLPNNWVISGVAGFFQRNRLGFQLKWRRYLFGPRLAIGMDGTVSNFTYATGPSFYERTEKKTMATYNLRLDYLWMKKNVLFEVHAGRVFLEEDGVIIRAFRQFDEKRFGVEFRWTDRNRDGGVFVRWPLFPRKYTKPSRVRITGSPYIDVNYSYQRFGHRDDLFQVARTLVDGLWEYWPANYD